jgi:predicted membrane protein
VFFPAVLILVGLLVIFNRGNRNRHRTRFEDETVHTDFLSQEYVFGGGNISVVSNNFKGGKFTAVFGGGKIDLSRSELAPEGVNVLEVKLVFGGVEILVPRDWNVQIDTQSVFGGFSKKKNGISESEVNPAKTLVIKGSTVFGGGEVKRV